MDLELFPQLCRNWFRWSAKTENATTYVVKSTNLDLFIVQKDVNLENKISDKAELKTSKKNGKSDSASSLPVIGSGISTKVSSTSTPSPAATVGNNRAILNPSQQRSLELQFLESSLGSGANSLLTSSQNPSPSSSPINLPAMPSFRPVIKQNQQQHQQMMNNILHNPFASLVNATTSLLDDDENQTIHSSSESNSNSYVPRTPSPVTSPSKIVL